MSRSAIIIREVDSNSTLEILWLFPLSSVGQSAQRWIWKGRRFESFSEIAKTVLSVNTRYFYFFPFQKLIESDDLVNLGD